MLHTYPLYLFTLFFLTNCEDESSEKKYLFINEFLASNNSVYADEIGEYDDWVELYNSSSDPIDISGMYLADDLEDNLKIHLEVLKDHGKLTDVDLFPEWCAETVPENIQIWEKMSGWCFEYAKVSQLSSLTTA